MIDTEREDIDQLFRKVQVKVFRQFQKNPDVAAVLFLIGVRELGQLKSKFSKEEKNDLLHVAVCTLLSAEGFYEKQGTGEDGWPIWIATKKLPTMTSNEQEYLLKKHIIRYFDTL